MPLRLPKRPLLLLASLLLTTYTLYTFYALVHPPAPIHAHEIISSTPAPTPNLSLPHAKRAAPPLLPPQLPLLHLQGLPTHPPSPAGAPGLIPAWYANWTHASVPAALESLRGGANASVNASAEMQVVPFYYRAALEPEADDITLTTLVTPNRFPVLARLAAAYKGPISATIYIPSPSSDPDLLTALHALYTSPSHPHLRQHVDIHLALSPPRAFNAWRNVARAFARTEYIMLLDVDFYPCTDFRARVRGSGEARALLDKGAALVVPALEYTKHDDGRDAARFPRSKQEALALMNSGALDMFHRAWAPGHTPTDYARFASAKPGELYKVKGYTHAYEPYVIFRRDGAPWCDERFVGYGANKAACLFELYLSGRSFYVLSDDFLIHQSHAYMEDTRKAERKVNKKLYAEFREETCLNYLTHFIDTDTLGKAVSHNARVECKKISRVAKRIANAVALKRLQAP